MIDELDEALRQLLIHELPIDNGEVDVEFDQPRREWSARLSRPTLNLFLYDVRENQKLRQTQPMWETERNLDGTVSQHRKPVRIDLFYMITAWATEPEDEHRLLSRTLVTLFRFPVLPEAYLSESLSHQTHQISFQVAQYSESQNPTDIWNVLDNEMRPVVAFMVTLTLDPYSVVRVPLVRQREIRVGPSGRPALRQLDEGSNPLGFWTIGGSLHSQAPLDVEKLRLTLLESGQRIAIHPDGRFTIGRLRKGQYTLEVDTGSSPAKRYAIMVPAPDYELEI